MGSKIASVCHFVKRTGDTAIITSIDKLGEAIDSKAGTRIIP